MGPKHCSQLCWDNPKATVLFSFVSTGDKRETPQTSSSTINSHIKDQSESISTTFLKLELPKNIRKQGSMSVSFGLSWTWAEAMWTKQ